MHTFNIIENPDFRTGRYILYIDGKPIHICDDYIVLVKMVDRLLFCTDYRTASVG